MPLPVEDEKWALESGIKLRNAFGSTEVGCMLLSGNPKNLALLQPLPGTSYRFGDLFQEILPGWWISRGRDDDWIKSQNSLLCDTKTIEDNTRAMCPGLVTDCIVVGTARPSPVLFVEPAVDMDHQELKQEILQRTGNFHSRRDLHGRITCPDMIVIVPRQTLPRTATKGNICRKAVEEAFKDDIDRIFANRYPVLRVHHNEQLDH